ncbi:unnamed protein product, partial [Laminaria digitata]
FGKFRKKTGENRAHSDTYRILSARIFEEKSFFWYSRASISTGLTAFFLPHIKKMFCLCCQLINSVVLFVVVVRGTIVNRTHDTHKNLYDT